MNASLTRTVTRYGWLGRTVAALLAAASLATPALAQKGNAAGGKYALLVGVREYDPTELKSLPYTEQDISDLAEVLKQNGYAPENVVLMTQTRGAQQINFLPTAANIRKQLRLLLADRTKDDTVLVAFAGHGVQFRGSEESFFCPVDAKLATKRSLVSIGEVYRELEQCQAGFKLLLVDACRNDPLAANSRSRSEADLESVTRPQLKEPPGGVAAFFSCAAGEKAYESDKLKHGVFFNFVVEGLKGAADLDKDDQVDLPELERFVKRRVSDFVRNEYSVRQMPELINKSRGLLPITGGFGSAAFDDTLKVGLEHYNRKAYDLAIAEYTKALNLKKTASAFNLRGNAYHAKRDYRAAIADYTEAITLDPKFAVAYANRGGSTAETGDYRKAILDYSEALRIDDTLDWVWVRRSIAHRFSNELDKAIEDATRALQLKKDAETFNHRGNAYHNKKDYAAAIADYTEAIRLNPRFAMAYANRGGSKSDSGDYKGAISDYSEAIRLDRSIDWAYRGRGVAYVVLQDFDRAIPDLTEAYNRGALKDAPGLNDLGFALNSKGEYRKAIPYLTKAIELDPKSYYAWNNRGWAYVELGQLEVAMTDLNRALELNANDPWPWNNRGLVYMKQQQYDRALSDFIKAVKLDNKNATALNNLGWALLSKGEYQKALTYLDKAIELNPRMAWAWQNRSICHEQLGNTTRAQADRARARQLDPRVADN